MTITTSPLRAQRTPSKASSHNGRSSTKRVIVYFAVMLLVSAASMIFSFYRSMDQIAGSRIDEWNPLAIASYLQGNATTEGSSSASSSLFSTDTLQQFLPSRPSLPGDARQLHRSEIGELLAQEASPNSPYAYAFVIGGCNPSKPAYRNYIFNILIAARILHSQGSTADIIVLFQMSFESAVQELPAEDVRILQAMNVTFSYIPRAREENFFKTMLDKFRILGKTQYRRILFMDGDVMPTGNLDYLFELSDGDDAILKENFVVTGREEPANGGFFMLSPGVGELEEMNDIIHDREVKAQSLPYPYFDDVQGWGHEIESPDQWQVLDKAGTNWTFWASFADQGLLYHWVKYAKKSVSIAYQDKIQNFGALPNGTVVLEETLDRPFSNYSKPIRCLNTWKLCRMGAPRSDFVHFTGRKKPWFHGPADDQSDENRFKSASHFWFYQLQQLNTELALGLNFSTWETGKSQRPLLGMYPLYGAVLTSNTNLLSTIDDEEVISSFNKTVASPKASIVATTNATLASESSSSKLRGAGSRSSSSSNATRTTTVSNHTRSTSSSRANATLAWLRDRV